MMFCRNCKNDFQLDDIYVLIDEMNGFRSFDQAAIMNTTCSQMVAGKFTYQVEDLVWFSVCLFEVCECLRMSA